MTVRADPGHHLEAEHLALLKGGTEKEAAVTGSSDSLEADDGGLVSQRR